MSDDPNDSRQEQKPAGMNVLYGFLKKGELVLIAVLVVLLIMHRMGYDTSQSVQIAFMVLAAVYFLMAYKPPAAPGETSTEKKGFAELLFLTILPKMGWIACSVLIVGVMFRLLHLPGAAEMMMIGTVAGLVPIALIGMGLVQGSDKARVFLPLLIRLIALDAICVYYLLFQTS
ncbi:MAG: hypothetical protein JST46_05130 [Bacteroidetes bacterium]|nr:hypothetical protein [Bacteroidota bacterium]